jgi:prepilin-type N-terminal cleavage/methylation domain-containing protein
MKIPRTPRHLGFTLMEILVVIAIIVVLAAIAFPVYGRIKSKANMGVATSVMKQLCSAVGQYAAQNNGELPAEDTKGQDDWQTIGLPEADKAWYNSLPKMMGVKPVGDFARDHREAAFYTKENFLFLPGAGYPEGAKKLAQPYFAIAINGRLQRKDKDGKKNEVRLNNIVNATNTVIFLEQGLPGEPKAHPTIAKTAYDGAPKGNAKSFVARYTGKGLIGFVGGNIREVAAKEILSPTGDILWSSDQVTNDPSAIVWTADPKDDPNGKSGK